MPIRVKSSTLPWMSVVAVTDINTRSFTCSHGYS